MHTPALAIGTVYGAALNDRALLDSLGAALHAAPYRSPPVAPVLYVKTRNTHAAEGARVAVPADPGAVRIDATIGAVIGRRASRLDLVDAMAVVDGYVIASDVTLPYESHYRPTVRQRCRDGYCPMSAPLRPGPGFDVDRAEIVTLLNGAEAHRRSLSTLVRPLARLLVDVTEFMTLAAGDVLLLGPPDAAPLARAGDAVRIEVPGLGALGHALVAEAAREELS